MNSDQLQSLIRAVLKIGSGYLMARGIGSGTDWEMITAGALGISAVIWGYFHRSPLPVVISPVALTNPQTGVQSATTPQINETNHRSTL